MSAVYDAIDVARNDLGSIEETRAAIESVVEVARDVIEEYREAAENFGGGGPNGEKAEELEAWVQDLEQFEPEGPEEEEFVEEGARMQALERVEEMGDLTFNDAMEELRKEWEEEHGGEELEAAIEAAKEEATELLDACPV